MVNIGQVKKVVCNETVDEFKWRFVDYKLAHLLLR